MKFSRRLLRVAALLCVFLVVSAQCLGVGRAFLCECSGVVMMTEADHCHDAVPCSDHEGECGSEDREDHAVTTEELRSVTPGSIAAPEMVPVLLAILPQSDRLVREACAVELRVVHSDASRPPPAVVTARAVELLI